MKEKKEEEEEANQCAQIERKKIDAISHIGYLKMVGKLNCAREHLSHWPLERKLSNCLF